MDYYGCTGFDWFGYVEIAVTRIVEMTLIGSDKNAFVFGLGATGYSTARHLQKKGYQFDIFADNYSEQDLSKCGKAFPDSQLCSADIAAERILLAQEVYISPGVSLDHPILAKAKKAGVNLSGDMDLFFDDVRGEVVLITGTNGKTTVTSLVGHVLEKCGVQVAVGGNIGTPMLDLLDEGNDAQNVYILEVSSFQLERSSRMKAKVACILNVSEDHIDRHGSLMHYQQAKQRIYRDAQIAVYNADDKLTYPLSRVGMNEVRFGKNLHKSNRLQSGDVSLFSENGIAVIRAADINDLLLKEVTLAGEHNYENVAAAVAIACQIVSGQCDFSSAVKSFSGLAHRCQLVGEFNGVRVVNDSKATNIGATIAALKGLVGELDKSGKIIVLLGGRGKGADFSQLAACCVALPIQALVYGEDAVEIVSALTDAGLERSSWQQVSDMGSAVSAACAQASEGDLILLSPACASLDAFSSYQQRGEIFEKLIRESYESIKKKVLQ